MRIAHLSDVHILGREARRSTARYRLATKFVSMGRRIDPRSRARKLARALGAAKESGADHVVISGDLTEIGDETEFEYFAEVLSDAKLHVESLTLVPGNHDAYTADGWKRALSGPLRPFAGASAEHAGKVVDRGDVVFLPLDSSCFQTMARSGGEITRESADAVESRLSDPAFDGKALVLVLHHPPFAHRKTPGLHSAMQWLDGLRGGTRVSELLSRHPRLQILHGHLHRIVDRAWGVVGAVTRARVFGAPAICDDKDDALPRVRLYEARPSSQRDGEGAMVLESAGIIGV